MLQSRNTGGMLLCVVTGAIPHQETEKIAIPHHETEKIYSFPILLLNALD